MDTEGVGFLLLWFTQLTVLQALPDSSKSHKHKTFKLCRTLDHATCELPLAYASWVERSCQMAGWELIACSTGGTHPTHQSSSKSPTECRAAASSSVHWHCCCSCAVPPILAHSYARSLLLLTHHPSSYHI
ncbi:P-loop containing nucleoside triphosphatehydrolases superfamily protein [Striga asiatica]|uniref:P-loop containing nucleoside triphosphatehydrolases superfamily protein n=1 Tax=Striga asiatica TaxID=4170 RepID=A0A5A7PF03_STRAF|nr:P-loop containing nucleoside triphosphatehydrolases superfamily protein [Striga asiatica]